MARKNNSDPVHKVIGLVRIALGSIFLWAFVDKLFGLGFATCRDAKTGVVDTLCGKAWVNGGSPTDGFLKNATKGPFEDIFKSMAGNTLVEWLFMLGLLLIGVALIAGVAIKLASYSGALMMIFMWLAALPPANNPVVDDHVIYALVLMVILLANKDQRFGLGGWWSKQPQVKKHTFLQ